MLDAIMGRAQALLEASAGRGRYLAGGYSDADSVLAPILCRLDQSFPAVLAAYTAKHLLLAPYLQRLRATPACAKGTFEASRSASMPHLLPWLLGYVMMKTCGCVRPPGA